MLPLAWPSCLYAALAVTVLALGELSASKLVETPGDETFAHAVFTQMHFGIGGPLAALCLILLAGVAVGGAGLTLADRLMRGRLRGWMG